MLAAIAGLFHGYAYGEAIVGAQMTPLVAYLLGFTLIQYVVALVAQALGNVVIQQTTNKPFPLMRFAGFAICAIGVVFLTNSISG
jgi:urease accessory protein